MFDDVDIWEALKSALVVTFYLVVTVAIIWGLSYTEFFPANLRDMMPLRHSVIFLAGIFNLVFAYGIADQF